jgi:hypothetical protein
LKKIIFLIIKIMQQGQFRAAALEEITKTNSTYTNARYAPLGDQSVGQPFPLYKQPAAYFTRWTPAGQAESNRKRQMNLPTNNNAFRQGMIDLGVGIANQDNIAWMNRTQTLSNNGDPLSCVNDTDCEPWQGTTCNPQHQSWNDAKGNQGNYCSTTIYPELAGGSYFRKDANQGGIGKECRTSGDCGQGYSCNQQTDFTGKNIQQTGFCSQVYNCPDGSKQYMGYPYNSSWPVPPPKDQNNNGQGYSSKEVCLHNIRPQQNCVNSNGKWFAVYPGYCPVPTNLRKDDNPVGSLYTSSVQQSISIPAYASNAASTVIQPVGAFAAWNINSSSSQLHEMNQPLEYSLSINPIPPNQFKN